jgi:hypothetical protein
MRSLPFASIAFLAACGTSVTEAPDAGAPSSDAAPIPPDAGEAAPDAEVALPDASSAPDAMDRPLDPMWTRRGEVPPSAVRSRWGTRAVSIPDERRLIVFSGSQYPRGTIADDHWSLSFADDTWTPLSVEGGPSPRYCHCATYLPEHHQVLVVGGRDDRGPLPPGAWIYDLAGDTWAAVEGAAPPGVIGCGIAWMPTFPGGGRAIVFGGGNRTGLPRDTWIYDPNARSFTSVRTASVPPGRGDPMMTFDPSHGGRLLLFGGAVNVFPPESAVLLDDLWAFDGTDWRAIHPSGDRPEARRFAGESFDELRKEWIIFGGTREVEDFDDLWRFDAESDTWTKLQPWGSEGVLPSARGFVSFGYDPVAEEYRMFGGLEQPDYRTPTEAWTLKLRP